jgi:hypothetical protein
MGNTVSSYTPQPNIQKKPESIKEVAYASAMIGKHMDYVCARIIPVGNGGKQTEVKSPLNL